MSVTAYFVLIGLVVAERFAELALSRRHEMWARARGALEAGRGHYPLMVLLHGALLVGCVVEVRRLGRPFPAFGWVMLGLVVAAQALRWWCIATLGRQWSTRVLVVPGMSRVTRGPYRLLRHPNYLAVVVEGIALPLVHGAWITAVTFTVLNSILLRWRIVLEDKALRALKDDRP